MPRWDPQAEDRLRTAAIELFLELGYENVTVAQIAERAGLDPAHVLPILRRQARRALRRLRSAAGAVGRGTRRADPELAPFEAVVTALADVGAMLGDQVALHAVQRREVIARSPELQERGRTKFAAVAHALGTELTRRGTEPSTAAMLADVGVAVFRTGFDRWVDDPEGTALPDRLREAGAELTDAVTRR